MAVSESYALAAADRDVEELAGPILRLRSVAARDIVANLASGRDTDFATLAELIATEGVPAAMTADPQRRRWAATLAKLTAAHDFDRADRDLATAILEAITHTAEPGEMSPEAEHLYAQLLFYSGDFDRAERELARLQHIDSQHAEYLRIDLANPFARPGMDQARWLTLLNGPVTRFGEPVGLLPDGLTPFDRLTCDCPAGTVDGPLISVVMSAFKPDETLLSSARSILAQTWGNLELLIVDDGSGPGFDAALDEAAALDPRVRVIRRDTNGGTYVVRNAALRAAGGTFITCQDSDDWSHPRRLERQVTPMIEDPEVIGTISRAIRALPDLTHQWFGQNVQRPNASSLMFRAEQVGGLIGFFDEVRKGSDTEYHLRMEAAFGRKVLKLDDPMAYTRLQLGSLSRSDFTMGWTTPTRIAYYCAALHWHDEIARGADPYVGADPGSRPFPAPPAFLRGIAPNNPEQHYDVILVDDWAGGIDGVAGGLEQIRILVDAGLSVALVHLESLARLTWSRIYVDWRVQQLINDGVVDRVTVDQPATADLLIVRDPTVVQFADCESVLRAARVVLAGERAADAYPGLTEAFDIDTCRARAATLFGAAAELAENAVPIEAAHWARGLYRRNASRPVIGRTAWEANPMPEAESAASAAYPPLGKVDVRILAHDHAGRLRRYTGIVKQLRADRTDTQWAIFSGRDVSLRAFLRQLDFSVWFADDDAPPPAFQIAAAMASGVVPVLPERCREQYGDAAIYYSAADVESMVCALYADLAAFDAQVNRGRAFVAERHSAAGHLREISALLGR